MRLLYRRRRTFRGVTTTSAPFEHVVDLHTSFVAYRRINQTPPQLVIPTLSYLSPCYGPVAQRSDLRMRLRRATPPVRGSLAHIVQPTVCS
jgi:hypothetical protein